MRIGAACGQELKRSKKLDLDPVLELKHIVGYSAATC